MSLKIDNIDAYGFEAAIRGMRNPMNSWDQSDSHYGCHNGECGKCQECVDCCGIGEFIIGEKDLSLMKSLIKGGTDHAKFLRFITVSMDIAAPFYWWKEFRTYRAGVRVMDGEEECTIPDISEMDIEMNSCSTMHKLCSKPFEISDFSVENLDRFSMEHLTSLVNLFNWYRDIFNDKTADSEVRKNAWYQIVKMLPSCYLQKRTVMLSYQTLYSMYYSRKNHKQDEWRYFCSFVKDNVPYMDILLGEE